LQEGHLLCSTTYVGQKPYYRPWVELFCINHRPKVGGNFDYRDSKIERSLLDAFTRPLGPGGKIFVEYYFDKETAYGLCCGFPVAVTRQGHLLFELGFTWFKDWYFSEGGHEGGQKLQGEKPLSDACRCTHLWKIRSEIESFLSMSDRWFEEAGDKSSNAWPGIGRGVNRSVDVSLGIRASPITDVDYLTRAIERAKKILPKIEHSLDCIDILH
jgi:hypothetical protein